MLLSHVICGDDEKSDNKVVVPIIGSPSFVTSMLMSYTLEPMYSTKILVKLSYSSEWFIGS